MRFRSDAELGVFLYRTFTPSYMYKRLVPASNSALAGQIENISGETSDWRFSEADLSQLMESVNHIFVKNALSEQKLEFVVSSPRERHFLDEIFGIEVSFSEQPPMDSTIIQPLRLLACMISMATYGKDVFSATCCFTMLCPTVLPGMRRLALTKKLNMLQALNSYVKNSSIVGPDTSDSSLADNIQFLRSVDQTIEKIHDAFDENKDAKKALRTAIDVASKFLLNQKEFAGNAQVSTAARFARTEVEDVVDNFNMIKAAVTNGLQKVPHYVTDNEKIAQQLLDRLFLLTQIDDTVTFSAKFRTPKIVLNSPAPASKNSDMSQVSTPKASVEPTRSSFINNSTPTPVRDPAPISTLTELIEAEKENIDPNARIVYEEEEKDTTPARPKPRGLRVRPGGSTGGTKAKRAPKPPARTLHDFFK